MTLVLPPSVVYPIPGFYRSRLSWQCYLDPACSIGDEQRLYISKPVFVLEVITAVDYYTNKNHQNADSLFQAKTVAVLKIIDALGRLRYVKIHTSWEYITQHGKWFTPWTDDGTDNQNT